jgi:hypothetical protein
MGNASLTLLVAGWAGEGGPLRLPERAVSSWAASEMIVVSLFGGPASWIAIGNPSPSRPAGTDAAGCPT